jgi:hypothetical protein
MKDPVVVAVIVHYGAARPGAGCLASLQASRGVAVHPIFVDNNPHPSPALAASTRALGGQYFNLPHNPGYAGGSNAGIRAAQGVAGAEMLILLNSDVRLEPRCLEILHRVIANERALGVVGPGLLREDAPGLWWGLGGEIRWPEAKPRALLHGRRREEANPGLAEVDFVCGAAMAFSPRLPESVGCLSERYYLYYEDADFCLRVRRAGLRVGVVPEALAWHQGGASFNGRVAEAAYYQVRNRLLFSRQWNPSPRRGRFHRFAFSLEVLWRALGRAASGRRGESAACLRALLDYLRGRTGKRSMRAAALPLPGREPGT